MAAHGKRYVVVGNGVAGTTAAEHLRKQDPESEVHLIGEERYPLYNRVALPPFLKGDATEAKVMMRTVEDHEKRGIRLHLGTRVEAVDVAEHVVRLSDGKILPFDKLLVATGGRPNPLPAAGSAGVRYIYNFQTLDDAKELSARIAASRRAVAVGGSFIAYELAEGFRARGLETVWIIRGGWFLRRVLDEEGGSLVDRIARDHGVEMVYHEEVAEVKAKGGAVSALVTKGGRTVDADVVGVGLGLTLNVELLREAGIETNHGIRTDACLRTSHPDVFAAGDVAEFYDSVTQSYHTMGTWNNAVSHGKTAAENMLGGNEPYETVPTYTSGLFDSKLAVMGTTPEISPEVESVSHCDIRSRNYRRLFFLGGRLVGAVLIGDMSARRQILQMIRSGERVSDRAALLGMSR